MACQSQHSQEILHRTVLGKIEENLILMRDKCRAMTDCFRSHLQQLFQHISCRQTEVVAFAEGLAERLACKVTGAGSDRQTSVRFLRELVSTFCAVAVCAGIVRSCLASDTDSSAICLPAAQDASFPPTVLMFIDRVVHAKPK